MIECLFNTAYTIIITIFKLASFKINELNDDSMHIQFSNFKVRETFHLPQTDLNRRNSFPRKFPSNMKRF